MANSGTVFLIDDDVGVRDSLSLLLSLKGVRTLPFVNAESFIETYQPEWPGCVLTDLRMPGMTGLELQAALRGRGMEVPVVMLTAHGDVATACAALKNGAFDFLEKPIDDGLLLQVLENALRVDRERRAATASRSSADARIGSSWSTPSGCFARRCGRCSMLRRGSASSVRPDRRPRRSSSRAL